MNPARDFRATNEDQSSPARAGLSRRNVVKAGAVTAWSVPLIQIAAAAPAMAASGPAALSVAGFTATRSSTTVTTSATINNANTQATTALQVILSLVPSGNDDLDHQGNAASTTPTGFSAPVKATFGDHNRSVRFTYTALPGGQIAGNGSSVFNPTITIGKPGAGTASLQAIPGGTGTSGSATDGF